MSRYFAIVDHSLFGLVVADGSRAVRRMTVAGPRFRAFSSPATKWGRPHVSHLRCACKRVRGKPAHALARANHAMLATNALLNQRARSSNETTPRWWQRDFAHSRSRSR